MYYLDIHKDIIFFIVWYLNKALFHSPKKEREIHLRYLVNAIVLHTWKRIQSEF